MEQTFVFAKQKPERSVSVPGTTAEKKRNCVASRITREHQINPSTNGREKFKLQ
jgi:hypothetical protein